VVVVSLQPVLLELLVLRVVVAVAVFQVVCYLEYVAHKDLYLLHDHWMLQRSQLGVHRTVLHLHLC
jgi:hypothetical protein